MVMGRPRRTTTADNPIRRTLHRRLADEGTSFQALLDTLRSEMAAHLLRQRGVSLAEAADLLGFAEVSAFSRAFRRWYHKTPAAWRRDHE